MSLFIMVVCDSWSRYSTMMTGKREWYKFESGSQLLR